uniref:CPL domain-containing protein n=1 Tax=Ciona savignyi TaxID=51511 RepID=H2YBT2_CIOSA
MNKSFDPNTVSYLRQADSIYKNGFENEEMKMVFIENFFEEIGGSEVKLSLMKSTCFVLQGFVEVACPKHLLQLIKAYKEELQDSAESQQGCHLVQKTLQRIVLLKKEDPANTIWSEVDKTIEEVAEILCEDLPTWLKHKYASHVTRSVIETLGGAVFSAEVETTLSTCDQISSLKLFIDIICKMQRQQFVEIITHQSGTPSVSILLRICALRSETLIGSLCGKILKVCDDSTLIILAKDRTGSHLIEQLINSGNDETLKKISAIFTGDKL